MLQTNEGAVATVPLLYVFVRHFFNYVFLSFLLFIFDFCSLQYSKQYKTSCSGAAFISVTKI